MKGNTILRLNLKSACMKGIRKLIVIALKTFFSTADLLQKTSMKQIVSVFTTVLDHTRCLYPLFTSGLPIQLWVCNIHGFKACYYCFV